MPTAGAFLKSLLFGAAIAAAIGPIALLILATAANRGFASGAFAATGAALADFLYALAAFLVGALVLPLLAAHAVAVRLISAAVLIGLGLSLLLRAPAAAARAPAQAPARVLLVTLALTLVNPMTIVAFAGFAPQLPLAGSPAVAVGLAAALGAGSLVVALAVAAAGATVGTWLPGARAQRVLRCASGAAIIAFGINGLIKTA